MKLIVDEPGKIAIESLCHRAMKFSERANFTQDLAFVIQVLSAVEIETPDPPKQEEPANPPAPESGP